jgi:AraC family transcriptional regulator of adaptative response/methylated-DNA-[protein]-cysteine methyltransferase
LCRSGIFPKVPLEKKDMEDYERIEKAIVFLENNHSSQPSLEEIAHHIALSPYHTQRLFKRWAGISPKQFLQFLTLDYAKSILDRSGSLLDAAHGSGLSGSGRLHDLFITFDAVTPGEFKQKGENVLIQYGSHPSPFGDCLIGVTSRGICWLSFYGAEGPGRSLRELQHQLCGAEFMQAPQTTAAYSKAIFGHGISPEQKPLTLLLKGTNFQIKVWEALLKLPENGLFTYEAIAAAIGKPQATRAVASAIARNPVSYLIPCHRVLRKSGRVSGYRWGPARKKAIIAWEAAHSAPV